MMYCQPGEQKFFLFFLFWGLEKTEKGFTGGGEEDAGIHPIKRTGVIRPASSRVLIADPDKQHVPKTTGRVNPASGVCVLWIIQRKRLS